VHWTLLGLKDAPSAGQNTVQNVQKLKNSVE
jgi:hypothetical protein